MIIHTPAALTDEQAACTWVNYLTAWALATEDLKLQPDEPVLVTAAASHLGRAMLQIAAHVGFKVVGTVRRADQVQELLDLGAAGVIVTDSEDIGKRYTEITGQRGIAKAIDAVSGAIGTAVAGALAPRGTMIIYGLLSGEPIQVDGRIVFSEAVIRGWWLVRWMQSNPPEHVAGVIKKISDLFADGTLTPAVDGTVDLADITGMVERANTPGRHGKIVITGPA
jgi:NADPH:quinone reductase